MGDAAGSWKLTCVVSVRARLLSEMSTALNVTVSSGRVAHREGRHAVGPGRLRTGRDHHAGGRGRAASRSCRRPDWCRRADVTSTAPDGLRTRRLVVVATIGVVVVTVDCEAETVRFPKVTLALNPVRARTLSVVSVAV